MNDEHGVDYGACGAGSTVVYRTLQHGQAARFGQGKLWAKSGLWIRFTSHCTSRYRHYSGTIEAAATARTRATGGTGGTGGNRRDSSSSSSKSGNPLRNTSTVLYCR